MESRLVLEEKYSAWWTQITVGLALLAIVLFVIYSNMDDVLWKGVLRLGSFGFLAAAVFSGLKVMEGKHSIILMVEDGHLVASYQKKGRQVGEDIFELDNITALYVDHLPSYFFSSNEFLFNDLQVVMEQSDSDLPLTLAKVGGRSLPLSRKSADEAVRFITRHAEHIRIPEHLQDYLDAESGSE